jgi:ABC-type thiamine transport system ATPase subunit
MPVPDLDSPVPRHVEGRLKAAMMDTRVVAIVGPRQSGKTTLAKKLAIFDWPSRCGLGSARFWSSPTI